MEILVAYLLGILTAFKPKNHYTDRNPYPNERPKTQTPSDRPVAVMCVPPAESDEERTNRKKKERREKIKFRVEIFSAITLFCYFGVTTLIWLTAQKQTTLMRQQVVGTQGALIALASPTWTNETNRFHFVFLNTRSGAGVVTGSIIAFSATFQRESLPDRKPIGKPWTTQFSNEPVAPRGQYEFDQSMPYDIPKTDGANWPGKEGLSIDAHYIVDNGFGDISSEYRCFDWLPPLNLKSPIDNSSTSVGGGIGGPCPHDISWNLTKFRNDLAKGYTPQP